MCVVFTMKLNKVKSERNLFLGIIITASMINFTDEAMSCPKIRIHGMLAADCHGFNLVSIPQSLPSGIEILDASSNRLRILKNSSFSLYTSLRYLYLGDNLISEVETGTFIPLQYLEVLDLSLNAVQLLPSHLVSLPSLRKLDISYNPLDRGELPEFHSTSLQYLSLANCHLSEVPSMNYLPALKSLNLAENKLQALTTLDIAPLCSLVELNITGNSKVLESKECECESFLKWMQMKHISVVGNTTLSCITDDSSVKCNETETEHEKCEELFTACEGRIAERVHQEYLKKTWITTGSCVAAVIAIVILILVSLRYKFYRTKNNPNNKFTVPTEHKLLNEQTEDKKKENGVII